VSAATPPAAGLAAAALAAAARVAPPAGPAAPERRARLRACTLLLVDDEPANLDLLEALLEGEGYGAAGGGRLVRTTDPREVPALAEAHAPDLVLLDLHMPHRHGLAVLADLRAATPADDYRPVLVLTADVTGEAKEYALALGARDFVTKPFDATEVLLRVENLLDARVLQQDERRARERAEAAEARASLLAEWSRLLASSLDTPTVLEYLPRLVVPRWAAACLAAVGDDVVGGGAAGGGPAAAGADPTADLWPRFEAPVVTGEGRVGRVVVAGAGTLAADQGLADELASRLGLAAEHARLLAAAELATSERERLLAVVAHDLRNPLGAVAMYAEMLASLQPPEGDGDPADADRAAGGASREAAYTRDYTRAAIATIHQSAAGMQRLVEDLLDASSLRGGALRVHRTPARLGDAFAEAERMLAPLADRAGLALAIEAEGGAADRVAPVDAPRLVQLLSNLVGNAVKFTPPGGRVAVRYRADADALGASVSDTGPGIAAEDLPHLFTAFWRGDRRGRRGVGLGLWIARAVVEAHGGELTVDTGPGRGTTFHFTLPFADAVRRRED
jgi:signal transduction histidine kinase